MTGRQLANTLLVGCGALLLLGMLLNKQPDGATPAKTYDPPPPPSPTVQVDRLEWHLGGFGTIFIADRLVLKNTGTVDAKDIFVECRTYGRSGTEIGRRTETIYDVIPSGKAKTFRNVSFGFVDNQSSSGGCQVLRAKPTS